MSERELLMGFSFKLGLIFEIKFLNLPDDAPKSKRFKWVLWLTNMNESKILSFNGMTEQKRYFNDNISLDTETLTINFKSKGYKLLSLTDLDKEIINRVMYTI
jgi:hypothetical protein